MDIDREIMLVFQKDSSTYQMYSHMKSLGVDAKAVRASFTSLKSLGLITQTNDHRSRRRTFCVTKKGRSFMKSVYGLTLPDMRKTV